MSISILQVLVLVSGCSGVRAKDCKVEDTALCDNSSDDTAALQMVLDTCPKAGRRIVFPANRTCLTQPLNLSSHTNIFLEDGAVLRAGDKATWDRNHIGRTMITADSIRNVSITGKGTLDGAGEQWYHNNTGPKSKPVLVQFLNTTDVFLEDFTLLNAARQHMGLYGARFVARNIKVRSPNEISTDGIDIGAIDAYLTGADISNGDDCIVMKATAQNVLVENSIVRQGHGLGFGTTGKPNMSNITFRNIIVNGTMDGFKIKFKDNQHGSVTGVLIENITIINASRYGLMIDPQTVNRHAEKHPEGSRIQISNITFRNIRGNVQGKAGYFSCKTGEYACHNIVFEDVHLDAPHGCSFNNTFGHGTDVFPTSCTPPSSSALASTLIV